jgi:hypothetical protein
MLKSSLRIISTLYIYYIVGFISTPYDAPYAGAEPLLTFGPHRAKGTGA